jgi:cyanobactin maturation PatA/PatG family protease
VAVLDGRVDLSHPCFAGANLTQLPEHAAKQSHLTGEMVAHGTHVTSVIFAQHGSAITGIAPRCRGLLIPLFSDEHPQPSQADAARAIEQAIDAGAHIINFSGGQLTPTGEPEEQLAKAVRKCEAHNVLLVAAAGNNGCNCLHVPAAIETALAVGAMDEREQPIHFSNWGMAYRHNGVLAPGENILGALPFGKTARMTGTSFAAPIVSGVAALLLSLQCQAGHRPNPKRIRKAILQAVTACNENSTKDCHLHLAGKLNIPKTLQSFAIKQQCMTEKKQKRGQMDDYKDNDIFAETAVTESAGIDPAACGCQSNDSESETKTTVSADTLITDTEGVSASEDGMYSHIDSSTTEDFGDASVVVPNSPSAPRVTPNNLANGISASRHHGLVYVLGTLGYDFGTETRRDSFKQLMPPLLINDAIVPANPFDARQMVDYLEQNPSESRELLWTLNLEMTPLYAIRPSGPYARDVYDVLISLMSGQVEAEDHEDYIERVSIPARLTGQSVRLFSGQVVPVIEPKATRGLYGWKVNSLVDAALNVIWSNVPQQEGVDARVRKSLRGFLHRVYYDLRNLGATSMDRALNFAATNAFQAASAFSDVVVEGMELADIQVERSPFCRIDSDCWDVKLRFFDPENNKRACKVFRFTIDVSDIFPVTLGEMRVWSEPCAF